MIANFIRFYFGWLIIVLLAILFVVNYGLKKLEDKLRRTLNGGEEPYETL